MTTILLVDDEKMITGPLARKLRESGYRVLVADNGRIGLETALTENPDVVVLDVLMPEMDGWEVCKALRKSRPVPILMLTALSDDVDRILGLELGADDYLTKPFSSRELLARIRAMLRRVALDQTQPKPAGELTAGPLRIELDTRRAFKNNQELTLRYKEFELLSLLLHHVGQVVTRAELFDEVWGTDWLGDTRTLDVHVRWLREKVEANPSDPQFIQTVRGIGYRLAASE
ncbi:MAG: response regulator transcription factor [Chloroflexi bacterium]|nr:response regulator transcription factor [Chloroflexota bacterium]